MSEVEETLERIKNHKGVEGYVIADKNGSVLRRHPQMQLAEAEKYAMYMRELTTKSRGVVRDLNPKVSCADIVRCYSNHVSFCPKIIS